MNGPVKDFLKFKQASARRLDLTRISDQRQIGKRDCPLPKESCSDIDCHRYVSARKAEGNICHQDAMPYLKDEAIVIQTHRSKERDKLVVLFSKRHGLLKCIARRAVGQRSKFGPAFEILTHLRVQLFRRSEKMELYSLSQAMIVQKSPLLQADFETLSCGSFLCEVIAATATLEQSENELFQTLSQAREALKTNVDSRMIALAFYARALHVLGIVPSCEICEKCKTRRPLQSPQDWLYVPASGTFYCAKCSSEFEKGIRIAEHSIGKLQHFANYPLKESLQTRVSACEMTSIWQILNEHSAYHLGLSFRATRYLFKEPNA